MFSAFDPKTGSLLISEPFMLDQNFIRSILLLCDHDDENGTFGLILNHKSTSSLQLTSNYQDFINFPLYIGGPMEEDSLTFIHRAGDRIADGKLVYQDIYFGGDFEEVSTLIHEGKIKQNEIKFFKGYAGWQSQQLNEEILNNSWAIHNHFASDLPFLDDGENLWKQALIDLGPRYAHVANFPKSTEYFQN